MEQPPKKKHNYVLSIVLLAGVAFFVVQIVRATAPDPGHNYTEVSGGVVQGNILYGSATDVLSALAKDANATRYLSNTGTSNNPAWAQINLANGVTGTLADGNIASALTGKTYNALTLTAQGVGFTVAGGTTSKTLTVTGDATISGTPPSVGGANTWTALNTFNAGVSVSTNFEVTGNNRLGINAGNVTNTNLEVGGTASTSRLIVTGAFNAGLSNVATVSYSRIGTSTSTHGLSAASDLLLSGQLSVDSQAFFDAAASVTTNFEVRGIASASKFFGNALSGLLGTTGCSGSVADKLLYNSTTGVFSCGTDQTGGAGSASVSTNFEITTNSRLGIFSGAVTDTTLEVGGIASVSGSIIANGALTVLGVNNNFYDAGTAQIDGNVGIGTNSVGPAKLTVDKTQSAAGGTSIKGAIVITDVGDTSGALDMGIDGTGTFYSWIQSRNRAAATYYSLALNPVGGYVGIGTTAPLTKLDVWQGTASASRMIVSGALNAALGEVATVSYSRFGTHLTNRGLSAASDLLISGRLGVDGQAFFDAAASVATNFEVFGYASVSKFFGNALSGLLGTTGCSGTVADKLLYNSTTGVFSCGTDQTGGGSGTVYKGIEVAEGTVLSTHFGSISFDPGMFNIGAGTTASATYVRLDWVNGPASRAAANTWATTQTFSVAATFNGGAVFPVDFGPSFGDSSIAALSVMTPDALEILSGPLANSVHVNEVGDLSFNFNNGPCATSACTDPTLIVHSHNQTTTQWISLAHDATNGILDVGTGRISMPDGMIAANASISTNFEVLGYASASKFFGNALSGLLGTTGCTGAVADKLLYNSTTGVFSCGTDQASALSASISTNFELTTNSRLGINAGAVTNTTLEVGGIASISGALNVGGAVVFLSTGNLSAGTITLGVLSGALDCGGCTSLEVPNAAAMPTLDAAGEVGVTTASVSLGFFDGTNTRRLRGKDCYTFAYETPTKTDDWGYLRFDDPFTIEDVTLVASGTNAVGWNMRHGVAGTNTNLFTADKSASTSTGRFYNIGFNDATLDDGNKLTLRITSASAMIEDINITVCGRY